MAYATVGLGTWVLVQVPITVASISHHRLLYENAEAKYAPMKLKETWVLLRGLARERGHWGSFLEDFAAACPDATLLCIDLPGAGEHRDVTSPLSLRGIAEFVRDRAREQTPDADRVKFHLFGNSLGAMVAFEWMRAYPTDVAGCVVVNTSLACLSPGHQRMRWQVWGRFLKALATQSPRDRERAFIDIVINDPAAQARALAPWTKLAIDRPIGFRTLGHQLLAAGRASAAPVVGTTTGLVLSSLGDRLVDPACSTAVAKVTGWPLVRHPWAGHDLTWDDGPWVAARVKEWRDQVATLKNR